MLKFQNNILFKDLTTLKIGGPIKLFLEVRIKEELIEAARFAKEKDLAYLVIGSGSNLLVSDEGFDGLVIKNNISGITQEGNLLIVKSGTVLQDLVDFTIENNLGGMNKMVGIPGTVGGAVYGNAGAYGQTVSDYIKEIVCFDPERGEKVTLEKTDCRFSYRDSGFKKNSLIILEVIFNFPQGDPQELKEQSAEVLQKRTKKYKPGIKCPGSFFKNVLMENLTSGQKKLIPKERDCYGKIPAWYFLDSVGARGDKLGQIQIADFHGNLFINTGGGKAEDFYILANKYFKKVKDKFGIELEPEVQLVNLPIFR